MKRSGLFTPPEDEGCALKKDGGAKWRAAGNQWQGGNLKGVMSKLDYLKNLGRDGPSG